MQQCASQSLSTAETDDRRLGSLSNKHLCLKVPEAGKSKIKARADLASSEGTLLGRRLPTACSLYFHIRKEGWRAPLGPFTRALITFIRAQPLGPNYLPKATPPNTIALGVRVSTHKFRGQHKHSINCSLYPNCHSNAVFCYTLKMLPI